MYQKIVSAAAIVASLASGALASTFDAPSTPNVPTVRAVLPDTLPLDLSGAGTVRKASTPVQAPKALPTAVQGPAMVLVWTCGNARPLAIGSGTVRECSYAAVRDCGTDGDVCAEMDR